jgi:hypothetical protein
MSRAEEKLVSLKARVFAIESGELEHTIIRYLRCSTSPFLTKGTILEYVRQYISSIEREDVADLLVDMEERGVVVRKGYTGLPFWALAV